MKNFSTFFWSTFETHKDDPAFTSGDEKTSFWEWTRETRRIALGLIEAGFEPGSRIAIVSNDRKAMFDFAFAAWLVGAVVVPIPTGRGRSETLKRLARTGSDWVVVQDRESFREFIGTDDKIPASIKWVLINGEHDLTRDSLLQAGKSAEKRGKLDLLAKRTFSIDPQSPSLILTTFDGELHAVAFSGAKLKRMVEAMHKSFEWEGETIALQLSMGWFYGFLLGVYALVHRNTLIEGASSSSVSSAIPTAAPSILICGTAYLSSVAETWESLQPEIDTDRGLKNWVGQMGARAVATLIKKNFRVTFGKDLSAVYVGVSEATPPENVVEVFSEFDVDVRPFWGTEAFGITHFTSASHYKHGAVGRPLYGVACKTLNTKIGTEGKLAIRSETAFDAYWNGEGPIEFVDPWYQTDIQGRIESGFLYLA